MKLSEWKAQKAKENPKFVPHEIPRVSPSQSQIGPDVIVGGVWEIEEGKIKLKDDPMGRWISAGEFPLSLFQDALTENKTLTVTTEKIRGRWVVTEVK